MLWLIKNLGNPQDTLQQIVERVDACPNDELAKVSGLTPSQVLHGALHFYLAKTINAYGLEFPVSKIDVSSLPHSS